MEKPTDSFKKGANQHSFMEDQSFSKHLLLTGLYDSEEAVIENFDNLVNDLKSWLTSRNYDQANILLDLMLDLNEDKTRQDGITPSALHEVAQAIWLISAMENGLYIDDPEGVMSLIFCHDLGEDFGLKPNDIEQHMNDNGIKSNHKTEQLKLSFDAISKRYGKDGDPCHEHDYAYYQTVAKDKNASVAKMFDRSHNIMTLIGVKDIRNMHDYTAKTLQLQEDYIPTASELFPNQAPLYEIMEEVIKKEIKVSRFHTVNTGKKLPNDDELCHSMPNNIFKDIPSGLHPLTVPAERIRKIYPDTHMQNNIKRSIEIEKPVNDNSDDDKNEPVA